MQNDSNLKHGIPFGLHVPSQRMLTVKEATRGRACDCVCAACGKRLQARQGSIRIWHFAHEEETACRHAAETAIHRMAKQLIVERGRVFVPQRKLSRTIQGERRIWTETISVDVQLPCLQLLSDCEEEKTIGNTRVEGEGRRPDVLAALDGYPLAIEILNTHAVAPEKQDWLEKQGYSVLEIDVGDIAMLSPDQIPEALEFRLFETAKYSTWLAHAKDQEAKQALDQMEEQIRSARREDDQAQLARLALEDAEKRRREEAWKRQRDIDDLKVGVGNCTVRIGRNPQRVSLKIHGFASAAIFGTVQSLARKHRGQFNKKARCWEFHKNSGLEAFFENLCAELSEEFFGARIEPVFSPPQPKPSQLIQAYPEEPPTVYFSDPALQEAFDERAGILEFDAGLPRRVAEARALREMTAEHVARF